MGTKEIKVPDIGDFDEVPVIQVFVGEGDSVAKEDPLIELESDKATMEVPSSDAGTIKEMKVKDGDKVSEGTVICIMEVEGADSGGGDSGGGKKEEKAEKKEEKSSGGGGGEKKEPAEAEGKTELPKAKQTGDKHCQLLVLGSGPGGYTAAFRGADLGLQVILVERYDTLGGVCLNVGCIPSKALLHAAEIITEAEHFASNGIDFGEPKIDIDGVRKMKEKAVKQLTGGLGGLAKQRKVEVVTGVGTFTGANEIAVEGKDGKTTISFDQCIIAAGSQPVELPFIPHDDDRVLDSTSALELDGIPKRMLVIGGGIIGLEMACVYDALGADITVVELMDQIIPGADKDLVKPLHKRIEGRYEAIHLGAKVTEVKALKKGIKCKIEKGDESWEDTFDKVLVSVGRAPNGKKIGADKAGVEVNDKGFIPVDNQQRTNVGHIFAIGDIVGQPMLAHKAVHEGKVAAEVASGERRAFDARVIPSVAYTDPEVAWAGVTENQAKEEGRKIGKGVFPWAASGRALSIGRTEGMTKMIFDEETERVIGAGIVGPNAGELIAEVALAIEMGCDATDIGHTIHPHPTLSETVNFASEMYEGTITDLMPPKKKR